MITAQPANSSSASSSAGSVSVSKRFGVEVVGRLVEQQHVRARLQHLGEVHAVALAAREVPHLLLLVGALEVEGRDIGARIDLALAQHQDVVAARDFLPHRLVGVERVAALVDVAELHALADLDRAAVGLLLPCQHAKERGPVSYTHLTLPTKRIV